MTHHVELCEFLLLHQLRNIVNVVQQLVRTAFNPFAITMPAQIRHDHVVIVIKLFGGPIPIVTMILRTVDQ